MPYPTDSGLPDHVVDRHGLPNPSQGAPSQRAAGCPHFEPSERSDFERTDALGVLAFEHGSE